MKALLPLLLPALLLAACDPGSGSGGDLPDGTETLKQALPSAEEMTIRLPASSALVGEQAEFYRFTRNVTLDVNHLVRAITNVIEDVVELPPTSTDGETWAIWGPHTGALAPATWQVRVDKAADGSYAYAVTGWPRGGDAADAVEVLTGSHTPGDGPGRGSGAWVFDLTTAHGLDEIAHEAIGEIAVDFSLGDARELEVRFTEVQGPRDAMASSALYRYTDAADSSGTFDFVSNLDIHADDDPSLDRRELLQVRSRWLPTGPGRADVVATHGDLAAGVQVDLEECWDDGFARTWVRWALGEQVHTEGDEANCPYADRQAPQFEEFDADAFSDGDLVEAVPQPADVQVEAAPVADPVDEPATYYTMARSIIEQLNLHVQVVLGQIREITRLPPTRCEPGGCTWGPWTDWVKRISFRLEVHRAGEGNYTYQAQAKPFGADDADWVSLVEGGFAEGDDDGDGEGWFVQDLAAAGRFDGKQLAGSLRAEYGRTGTDSRLAVRLDDLEGDDNPGDPLDARYSLVVTAEGGTLDFVFPASIDDDPAKAAKELVAARVRWLTNGAGTGNARVTGGDVPEGQEYLGVECWDDRAAQTHVDFLPQEADGPGRPAIDAEACVFDDWQDASLPPMADELE